MTKTLTESSRLRYFSFFYLYVMQGVPGGFALIAITNFLSARQMTASDIAAFGAVVGLPWAFKFFWGPLVDRFQNSIMGTRRPWIIGAQIGALAASFALVFVKDPVVDFKLLVTAFVLHGIFASLQDISVDALAITVAPAAERGRINAFMKIGMISGQAIGAAGLSLVLRDSNFQNAALIQFTLLFVLTLTTILIRERPGHAILSWKTQTLELTKSDRSPIFAVISKLFRALIVRRNLVLFGAVAAVFISDRLFQRIFALHLIQKLGWADTAVSVLSGTYGTIAAAIVALAGGWLSDRLGALRTLVIVTILMGSIFTAFALAGQYWTNPALASTGIVMRQIFESLFSISALPVLMIICRKDIAATQFGFYMALSNQADVLGIYLSGMLFSYLSAERIILGCGLVTLMSALVFVILSRSRSSASQTMVDVVVT